MSTMFETWGMEFPGFFVTENPKIDVPLTLTGGEVAERTLVIECAVDESQRADRRFRSWLARQAR